MPGFTTPDGFIYPVQGDQPYTGLTPDVPGAFAVFQEQVQAKFTAQAADISALTDRVLALETAMTANRWRHINQGSQVGGTTFNITVPAGYERLRLTLVGDLSAADPVNLRFNSDSSAIYVRGYDQWDAAGTGSFEHNGATTLLKVANWSSTESNKSKIDIEPTDGSQNPSVNSYSTRISTTAGGAGHQIQFGWGKYTGDVVVSTITVLTNTATTFARCDWVLEGYLAP